MSRRRRIVNATGVVSSGRRGAHPPRIGACWDGLSSLLVNEPVSASKPSVADAPSSGRRLGALGRRGRRRLLVGRLSAASARERHLGLRAGGKAARARRGLHLALHLPDPSRLGPRAVSRPLANARIRGARRRAAQTRSFTPRGLLRDRHSGARAARGARISARDPPSFAPSGSGGRGGGHRVAAAPRSLCGRAEPGSHRGDIPRRVASAPAWSGRSRGGGSRRARGRGVVPAGRVDDLRAALALARVARRRRQGRLRVRARLRGALRPVARGASLRRGLGRADSGKPDAPLHARIPGLLLDENLRRGRCPGSSSTCSIIPPPRRGVG